MIMSQRTKANILGAIIILTSVFFIRCQKQEVNTPDNIDVDITDEGSIVGRVVHPALQGNHIIAGAGHGGLRMYLVNSSGQDVDTTITAANGAYSFDEIPPGTYTIEASLWLSSLYSDDQIIVYIADQTVSQADDFRVCNIDEAYAAGRIFNPDGTPYANRWVEAYTSEILQRVTTSSDGTYALNWQGTQFTMRCADGNLKLLGMSDSQRYISRDHCECICSIDWELID